MCWNTAVGKHKLFPDKFPKRKLLCMPLLECHVLLVHVELFISALMYFLICFICTVSSERHTQQRWRGEERSVNRNWAHVTLLLPSVHTRVRLCARARALSINWWGRVLCQSPRGQLPWQHTLFLYFWIIPHLSHSWLSHTLVHSLYSMSHSYPLSFHGGTAYPYKNLSPCFIEPNTMLYFYLLWHPKPL